jgi:hypothetical protein
MTNEDQIIVRRLASDVIAVAKAGFDGDWAAYIGAVQNTETYEAAIQSVKTSGCKLPQKLAELIFPEVAKKLKWRA